MYKPKFLITFFLFLFISLDVYSQSANPVILKDGLVINLGRYSRDKVLSPDAVTAAILTGRWKTPVEYEQLKNNDTIAGTWKKITADDNGWIRDNSLRNAYVYFSYNSDKDDIALVEAMGNENFYINGDIRSGNPYRYQDGYEAWEPRFDYSLIPVKIKKGNNDFLFACSRGMLKVKIHPGQHGLIFDPTDLTNPDIILNKSADTYGAIPVINATEEYYKGLSIKTWAEGSTPEYYPVNEISPLSILKMPFRIKLDAKNSAGTFKFNIALVKKGSAGEETLSSCIIDLKVVDPGDTHKETFISKMDGSVQYYAVNPPKDLRTKPALFLSLHGAGVEAINQATSYDHKNWGYIVAPTNRRPYGYNWENWGMKDGLEVLDIAKKEFGIDTNRVYLTGHSMGGHGTWQLGYNFADKFAAIGPSAGWISIWSYRIVGMEDSSNVKKMLVRSTKQSDTYSFTTNLKPDGIYIIHGQDDDNVPIGQAYSIVDNLSKFHKDYVFHIQPGAGHWWDVSDEPGADCVDWAPMFDFFAHHAVAQKNEVKDIDYVTSNPAVSSKNYWVQIINQTEQQKMSSIKIHLLSGKREFIGTTGNIETLSIDASVLTQDAPVTVILDGQMIDEINIPADGKIYLHKENKKWQVIDKPSEELKNPARCGNFREALNYNVVFVYGTHGTTEENDWAFKKARYDAEKIWYRGNGSVEVIKDDEFDAVKYKDRSVILFGNSKTNSAWSSLLSDAPVQIDGKKVKVGDKEFKGDDFACLMIRPRKDSKIASVAVVSGTGIKGMKLADLSPYYHPYINLPDLIIYNSDVIKSDDKGVKLTGYFGNDWSIEKGEFVNQ